MILGLVLLVSVFTYKLVTTQQTPKSATKPVNQVLIDDATLVIGDKNAPVSIIEYADYKCPECAKHNQDVGKRIRSDYVDTGKVNIVFRPYPVYSEDGARALAGSYCANQQGKFTEYHDKVFDHMWVNYYKGGQYEKAIEDVLTLSVMNELVASLGMSTAEYNSCLDTENTRKLFDEALFQSGPDEIQGTPSFIIGGKKIVGVQPYNVFKTLLDIQLR